MTKMIELDILVKNIRELVNPAHDSVVRGENLNALRTSGDVWIGATGDTITFIGRESDFNRTCMLKEDAVVIDGSSFVGIPGLVDPHNHLPFAGTRQDEFQMKLQGVSYQEIAAKGGGILGTVRKTREIATGDLVRACESRLDRMLLSGTTTTEGKSGYGLNLESEIKQLEALEAVNSIHPVEVVSTFLGAHDIPEEYKGKNREFLDHIIREVLPVVKERKLAEFVDIFCEDGYFSYEDTEYYLDHAIRAGFRLKVHADEFSSNNGAILAAKKNAVSAEHLIAMTPEEIGVISRSDTTCLFLPGVSFFLKMKEYAPAREVIRENGIVALGTDFNPGSSMVSSQLFIFHLGIYQMGLTIEEALNAITINAAYAIGRDDRVGSLAVGKKMDLLLLDVPDYSYMAYHLGINPIHTIIKGGEVVVKDHGIIYNK